MGGFFGAVSRENCAADVFYGTDYHSHLGTHRGGMAFWAKGAFHRTIHDISNSPFRTRFGDDFARYDAMEPNSGIGVISDTDDQPHVFLSHLGRYSMITVDLVANADALVQGLVERHAAHFSSLQSGEIMQTEVVAALINTKDSIVEGIRYVQEVVEGVAVYQEVLPERAVRVEAVLDAPRLDLAGTREVHFVSSGIG